MKRALIGVLRAVWAFATGTLWFVLAVMGVVVLALPQVWASILLDRDVNWIDGWLDLMEEVLDNLKG